MNMKRIYTYILCGLSLTGLFTSASADTGQQFINNHAPAVWVVKGNGQSYTSFDHIGMINLQGRLEYDTGVAGRIKSWTAEPSVSTGYGIAMPILGLGAFKQSKSYPVGKRPKQIHKNIPFSIPVHNFGPKAIAMCNSLANNLRNGGMTDQQIFSQDRLVSFTASLIATVNATGAGSNNQQWQALASGHNIKVRCAKWQGVQVNAAGSYAVPFKVIKATMNKQMIVAMNGVCKVKLTTAISTNKANAQVKFRYKSQSGHQSNIFTVKTAANKIAVATHTWDISNGPSIFDGTWIHMQGTSPAFESNTVNAHTTCQKGGINGVKVNPTGPKINPAVQPPKMKLQNAQPQNRN